MYNKVRRLLCHSLCLTPVFVVVLSLRCPSSAPARVLPAMIRLDRLPRSSSSPNNVKQFRDHSGELKLLLSFREGSWRCVPEDGRTQRKGLLVLQSQLSSSQGIPRRSRTKLRRSTSTSRQAKPIRTAIRKASDRILTRFASCSSLFVYSEAIKVFRLCTKLHMAADRFSTAARDWKGTRSCFRAQYLLLESNRNRQDGREGGSQQRGCRGVGESCYVPRGRERQSVRAQCLLSLDQRCVRTVPRLSAGRTWLAFARRWLTTSGQLSCMRNAPRSHSKPTWGAGAFRPLGPSALTALTAD